MEASGSGSLNSLPAASSDSRGIDHDCVLTIVRGRQTHDSRDRDCQEILGGLRGGKRMGGMRRVLYDECGIPPRSSAPIISKCSSKPVRRGMRGSKLSY